MTKKPASPKRASKTVKNTLLPSASPPVLAITPPRNAPHKPTKAELAEAVHKTVSDLVKPGLRVLFCGINPGLYTAATGHHFARPGNRFWPALYGSKFSSRLLNAWEERELLDEGLGITNVVRRTTATAAELNATDYAEGGVRLRATVSEFAPRVLAVLGVGAYRAAFQAPSAAMGLQGESIGETAIWVLPNPSGLNANYQLPDLIRMFAELREWVERAGA